MTMLSRLSQRTLWRRASLLIVSCGLLVLSGCASTIKVSEDIAGNLNDDLFPEFKKYRLESPEKIFYLGDDARAFVDEAISTNPHAAKNMRNLVEKIFDRADLGLTYLNSANSVANETFENQLANCLSLSIMTYAMANYAGFDSDFYEVDIPEYWTRRDGFSLLNGHINMRLGAKDAQSIQSISDYLDVDFDPQNMRKHFQRRTISQTRVIAMFYNNVGAEALIRKDYAKAYAYFRGAVSTDKTLSDAWVNLGILYRMNDAYVEAEEAYKVALALDDDNLTAWENMAVLYHFSGDEKTAADIIDMVKRRRHENPFYHFILGEQALEAGNLEDALVFYRRAYKLDAKRHEVLFGMGKAYYELGDISRAERYLTLAERYANELDAERYRGKLSSLQSRN